MNKIHDKIQKLLALSQSSNEHEALLAAAKASDLMTKHQIDRADVLVTVAKTDIQQDDVLLKGKRKWYNLLASSCAKLFDCKVLGNIGKHKGTIITFIGPKDAITSSQYLFKHLLLCWEATVKQDLIIAKRLATTWTSGSTLQFKPSHGYGYAVAINTRVRTLLTKRQEELNRASQTAALVPINTCKAVNAYVRAEFNTSPSSPPSCSSVEGARAGSIAGNNVPLGGAITSTSGYLA